MNCCSNLESKYEGRAVKDIPELQVKLVEIETDYKNWITTFKCAKCGQVWVEKYSNKGHGEVPDVYKLNN